MEQSSNAENTAVKENPSQFCDTNKSNGLKIYQEINNEALLLNPHVQPYPINPFLKPDASKSNSKLSTDKAEISQDKSVKM